MGVAGEGRGGGTYCIFLCLFNTGKANATLAEVIEAQLAVDTAMKEAKIALDLAKAIQIQASNNTDHVTGLIQVRFGASG